MIVVYYALAFVAGVFTDVAYRRAVAPSPCREITAGISKEYDTGGFEVVQHGGTPDAELVVFQNKETGELHAWLVLSDPNLEEPARANGFRLQDECLLNNGGTARLFRRIDKPEGV